MKTRRILSTTIASLLLAFPLSAATVTWDGGGGNNLISNMVNWNPDGAPLNDGSATLQFDGAVRLAPNFGAAFSAAGITFLNTADAFVLGGSTITIGTGGFLNSDTQTQTIDNNVTVGTATSAFNAANGALAFNGTVALGANPLAVNGAFATTFGGAITGTGTITKSAAGAMNLNATATAIGADFNLTGGTTTLVATGTTQTLSSTSTVAVSATGAFAINESLTLDGAQLTRDATSTLSIAGFKTLTVQNGGDVIITGGLTTLSQSTIIVTGAGSTFTTTSSLQFAGGNTTNVLAGGSLSAGAGSITIGGAGNGTVTVDGAGSSIIGGALFVSGGGSNSSLTLTNGSSGSFAAIQVDNTISAGTVGTFSIQSGATVTGTALSVSTFAGVNTGAVTVTGAGSAFTLTGAATAAIGAPSLSTGTLTIQNGTFTSGTGTTTVNTTGTININGGTANFLGSLVLSGGALNFVSGTLSIVDNFTVGTGGLLGANVTLDTTRKFTTTATTTIDATRTLTIDGGTFSTSALVNNGTLNFLRGILAVTGAGGFNIGTGALGSSVTLGIGANLQVTNTTTIDPFSQLTLNGGTLTTGALVNNGTLAFNSGTLAITGAGGFNIGTGALGSSVTLGTGANLQVTNNTTVATGALLRTTGGNFSGSTLTNNGTIDHTDGTFSLTGTLTNNAAGRIFVSGLASPAGAITNAGRITVQNGIGFLGGAGGITNTGLINGDGTIAKPVTNSGTGELRAEAGKTLLLTGANGTNTGKVNLQGGVIEFS